MKGEKTHDKRSVGGGCCWGRITYRLLGGINAKLFQQGVDDK